MSAVITDQFRILNASNFVDSVLDTDNSYYVFLGLSNPTTPNPGFGRTSDWNTKNAGNSENPTDNFQYLSHYKDTSLFGKKITSDNVRRVVKKVQWTSNDQYDEYRHNYGPNNPTPVSQSLRLYDSNYYVINKDFRVYICIDNGSSGSNPNPGRAQYEPTGTDTNVLIDQGDGYRWKYLFTISPSDIVKFDSSEYITLPNNWDSTNDAEISRIRDAGNSDNNNNQIKKVYIADGGSGYVSNTYPIIGDGSGAEVAITTKTVDGVDGVITSATVTSGGSGYTWGMVYFGSTEVDSAAKLIPIIPPSKGHGYDIYQELGAEKVLVYARFDDSTKNFPTESYFAQVGLIKDPQQLNSTTKYTGSTYSSLDAIKLVDSYTPSVDIVSGTEIYQTQGDFEARGYVASYDPITKVLKYYQDRSLYYDNDVDQTDGLNLNKSFEEGSYELRKFNNSSSVEFKGIAPGSASVYAGFSGSTSNGVDLGVTFTGGIASPQINKKTGNIIYIDNRPTVERNIRQKEDIKIILEF